MASISRLLADKARVLIVDTGQGLQSDYLIWPWPASCMGAGDRAEPAHRQPQEWLGGREEHESVSDSPKDK